MPTQVEIPRKLTMSAAEHLSRSAMYIFEAELQRDNRDNPTEILVTLQLATAHATAATAVEAVYPQKPDVNTV